MGALSIELWASAVESRALSLAAVENSYNGIARLLLLQTCHQAYLNKDRRGAAVVPLSA